MISVFYDITRIISRKDSSIPTGIDRVDIKYAYHFLKSNFCNAFFIFFYNGKFFLCDKKISEHILETLHNRWIVGSNTHEIKLQTTFDWLIKNHLENARNALSNKEKLNKIDASLFGQLAYVGKHGGGYYINTSHHGIGQIDAYYIFKTLGKLKIIFFVHDIIPIDFPEYVRNGDEITHQKRIDVISCYSDLILVNSEYTKNRLIDNMNARGFEPCDIKVLHIGVEDNFYKTREDNLSPNLLWLKNSNYFVYTGTIEPRKNHLMLLNLWRQYFTDSPNPLYLVLIGKRGWNNQIVFDMLDRSPKLKKYVIELSDLSDTIMASIIKNSKGVLFPAFVEGWGMPLVEALTMKVPVLAADIFALRESGNNLAYYIDPVDTMKWKNAIEKLAYDEHFRKQLIDNSFKFIAPKWEDTFGDLDNLLEINYKIENKISSAYFQKQADKKFRFFEKLKIKKISSTDIIADKFRRSLSIDKKIENSNIHSNIIEKFIIYLVNKLSEKKRRKIKKFFRDPYSFFHDSKKPFIKFITKAIDEIE
ncbi:MAG: glycosyltransferase family 4 protein [Campylobacteraceae bacterium]|jgi:glycosyltransferase involved in cell wall biosynthesis|nr:glycosyltransferase family 4 protein [Campylobacteraceae bacterium]